MLGAVQGIGRVQRTHLRLLQIFEDDRGFEDGVIADQQHRRLAERRNLQEPVRLVGEIDVDRSNGTPFSVSAITARCT